MYQGDGVTKYPRLAMMSPPPFFSRTRSSCHPGRSGRRAENESRIEIDDPVLDQCVVEEVHVLVIRVERAAPRMMANRARGSSLRMQCSIAVKACQRAEKSFAPGCERPSVNGPANRGSVARANVRGPADRTEARH